MRNNCRFSRGFSIVELVIVLLVSSVIAMVVVPSYAKIHHYAKTFTVKQQAYAVQLSLESYFLENMTYPDTDSVDELITLLELSQPLLNPFTGAVFSDEDGSGLLEYEYDSDEGAYELTVYGAANSDLLLTLSN